MKKKAVGVGYADQVKNQYTIVCQKTGEFFREVIKFGALLSEVEYFLPEGRGNGDGNGLKEWLADNCPEVNYNTVMGYKHMAEKCAKMIGGGSQALAALQDKSEVIPPGEEEPIEIDGKIIEKRDELFEEVDSRRKLEQMWIEFLGGRTGRGRPKGSKADLTRKIDSTDVKAAARAVWSKIIVQANATRVALERAVPLLSKKDIEEATAVLKDLLEYLNR